MGPAVRLLILNINPSAETRQGVRRIARALSRVAPAETSIAIRHFARVREDALPEVDGIVIGPQGVPFDAYGEPRRTHLFELLRHVSGPPVAGGRIRPVLGICGGHQALVLAHGGAIAPVHGGLATGSYAGHVKETGLRHVAPELASDPLAAALPGEFVVSHVEGVSRLPDEFELVGAGSPCRVQLVRYRGRPVWGAQFHPERGGDGDRFLRAWLSVVSEGRRKCNGRPSPADNPRPS